MDAAEELDTGIWLLRGFADTRLLAPTLHAVLALAPPRRMQTRGGHWMSAAMTSAGSCGWTSDSDGYRYSSFDPRNGKPWPPLPTSWLAVAKAAAAKSGFGDFAPNTCLIGVYGPGAGLGLHRDADEGDFTQPIVSLSIGANADFLLGGLARRGGVRRLTVTNGDVVVWGGPARLRYHGVDKISPDSPQRTNLSFRAVARERIV